MIEQLLRRLLAAWNAFFETPTRPPAGFDASDGDEPFSNVREFHPARRHR